MEATEIDISEEAYEGFDAFSEDNPPSYVIVKSTVIRIWANFNKHWKKNSRIPSFTIGVAQRDLCVYYIYNEIRVCPRLGAARADPPLSRMYPQGQCCLGANLAGATLLTED